MLPSVYVILTRSLQQTRRVNETRMPPEATQSKYGKICKSHIVDPTPLTWRPVGQQLWYKFYSNLQSKFIYCITTTTLDIVNYVYKRDGIMYKRISMVLTVGRFQTITFTLHAPGGPFNDAVSLMVVCKRTNSVWLKVAWFRGTLETWFGPGQFSSYIQSYWCWFLHMVCL